MNLPNVQSRSNSSGGLAVHALDVVSLIHSSDEQGVERDDQHRREHHAVGGDLNKKVDYNSRIWWVFHGKAIFYGCD